MSLSSTKKTVLAFSRVTPEMIERLQQDFNVIAPNPKLGDINAQFEEALPHAQRPSGAGRQYGVSCCLVVGLAGAEIFFQKHLKFILE